MPLFAIVAALLLSACSGMHSYKYKVGVSQCVGGKWREKVNDEMLSAQHLYGNEVKVSIKNANDDSRLQAKRWRLPTPWVPVTRSRVRSRRRYSRARPLRRLTRWR